MIRRTTLPCTEEVSLELKSTRKKTGRGIPVLKVCPASVTMQGSCKSAKSSRDPRAMAYLFLSPFWYSFGSQGRGVWLVRVLPHNTLRIGRGDCFDPDRLGVTKGAFKAAQ